MTRAAGFLADTLSRAWHGLRSNAVRAPHVRLSCSPETQSNENISCALRRRQSGNVITILLAAVALTGTLAYVMQQTMTGPLASATRVSGKTLADTQMLSALKILTMDAANTPTTSGDCDSDAYIEPRPYRNVKTKPVGGGAIPDTIGAPITDPWGTEYGYCVWDVGSVRKGAGCGGVAALRLRGSPTPATGNDTTQLVMAIVSAGEDRTFQTTCVDYVNATTPLITSTGDDIVMRYTYAEASTATSSVWSLKDGDPDTATTSKNVDIGAAATRFNAATGMVSANTMTSTGKIIATGGLQIGTQAVVTDGSCVAGNAATHGITRYNSGTQLMEICTATGWVVAGGGPAEAFRATALCTLAAHAGNVRYNDVLNRPEFCTGASGRWQPFMMEAPSYGINISPSTNNAMNISGPCSGGGCYAYSAWQKFVVYNRGSTPTATMTNVSLSGTNAADFILDSGETQEPGALYCKSGVTLAAAGTTGDQCVIYIRARANSNTTYEATASLMADAVPMSVSMRGKAEGFGCSNGGRGFGGIIIGKCTGAGGTEPGTGQLIVQEPGCPRGTTNEPVCTGSFNDDPVFWLSYPGYQANSLFPTLLQSDPVGPMNSAIMASYTQDPGVSFPALQYCLDLVKDGYDNWYLPAGQELVEVFRNSPGAANTFAQTGNYYATTYALNGQNYYYIYLFTPPNSTTRIHNGTNIFANPGDRRVRCVRRHNVAVPGIADTPVDIDPEYFPNNPITADNRYHQNFIRHTQFTGSANALTTHTLYVTGFNRPVTFTIDGDGNPSVQVNGTGGYVTSGTLNVDRNTAHTLSLRMTSGPAGTERTVRIRVGNDNNSWRVITTNPAKVIKVFTTSTLHDGNLGGVDGADAICRARATEVGLPGANTYFAFLNGRRITQMPWTAGRFEHVDGTYITNNFGNFDRAPIAVPFNKTETGAAAPSINWWAGYCHYAYDQFNFECSHVSCNGWTTNTGGQGATGRANATTGHIIGNTFSCSATQSLLCYGPN